MKNDLDTVEQRPRSVNPATEELLEEFQFQTDAEIEGLLTRAERDQKLWRRTSFGERSRILKSVATRLRAAKSDLAFEITLEMGKPIREAEAEIEKCAWNCDYAAENAEQWLRDEQKQTNASESYVSFLPLGTILAVMPWNFPFWQVFRFSAPSLMAGNAVVLKHAPNVMRCARRIESVFAEAGLPKGVFQNAVVRVSTVGRLLSDSRIAAATVTGSPRAGAAVAEQAGRALKKAVLELGGSDAFIVLADADLDQAVAAAVRGRFANCGQVCLAPKRFILTRPIADAFCRTFVDAVQQLRIGDPQDPVTQIGPMARGDLREELDRQVQSSVRSGARVLAGGAASSGRGYFYPPTVLADVLPSMPVAREETFGPVAALFPVETDEQALELANSSEYGLSANIWTRDIERARGYARQIAAGSVFINGVAASDPRLPIGGVKRSGFGRELAIFGIREFVNVQTVWIGPPK
ncbi:MAG: NAD-dependent succinate-semialdehyde dehydrogenase [Acidobacteriaceae bacterium]|nr:NAD-dependent succinate-semialdehyde dehydrogenase [Acidobacteriaceae bacterium]